MALLHGAPVREPPPQGHPSGQHSSEVLRLCLVERMQFVQFQKQGLQSDASLEAGTQKALSASEGSVQAAWCQS